MFKFLFQFFLFKICKQWRYTHWLELRQVEQYSEMWLELVFTLKKNAISSSLAAHVVKTEQANGIFIRSVEEISFVNLKNNYLFSYLRVYRAQSSTLPICPDSSGGTRFFRGSTKFWLSFGIPIPLRRGLRRFLSWSNASFPNFQAEEKYYISYHVPKVGEIF